MKHRTYKNIIVHVRSPLTDEHVEEMRQQFVDDDFTEEEIEKSLADLEKEALIEALVEAETVEEALSSLNSRLKTTAYCGFDWEDSGLRLDSDNNRIVIDIELLNVPDIQSMEMYLPITEDGPYSEITEDSVYDYADKILKQVRVNLTDFFDDDLVDFCGDYRLTLIKELS